MSRDVARLADDDADLSAFDRIEAEAHPESVEWVQGIIASELRLVGSDAFGAAQKAAITQFLVGDETKRTMFAELHSTIAANAATAAATTTAETAGAAAPAIAAAGAGNDEASPALATKLVCLPTHPHLNTRPTHPGMPLDVVYFVRIDPKKDITPENMDTAILWGVARGGNVMDSFLRMMQQVLAPTLLRNQSWPESITKEFSSVTHKFMATLTENANRIRGSTVLYVPLENLTEEQLQDAHNDKELVQRFESAVIHWTRQIKEVVNEKDVESAAENEGPLAEIEYWRARTHDLSNIRKQFIRNDVLQVVEVLQRAKSFYYLEPFLSLRTDIETQTKEAIDNLRFLSTLKEPCTRLSVADPQEIPGMVKELLQTVQMIYVHSEYYNKDRFYRLLRMISNEIVLRCRKKIHLQAIFDGHVERSMVALQESVEAGEAWMAACRKMLRATAKNFRGNEKADQLEVDETIFNEIDGFVKHRCMNLQEVCKGQLQFGFHPFQPRPPPDENGQQKDESEHFRGMLPCFGGAKGPDIESQLLDIQRAFKGKMELLRRLNYDILDVKATRWSDDFRVLKGELDNLGTMMTQIIQGAFDLVATVEGGAELLEAFHYLARREELERAVDRRKDDVIRIFNAEVTYAQKETTRYHPPREPPILFLHPPRAGHAFWARHFAQRIEGNFQLLRRCWYLTSSVEKDEAMSNYHKTSKSIDEIVKREARQWKAALPDNPNALLEIPLIAKREDATQGDVMTLTVNFSPELALLFAEVRFWQRLGEVIPSHIADICTKEERLRASRENVALAVRAFNSIVVSLNAEERRLFAASITALQRTYESGFAKLWSGQGILEYFVKPCRTEADKLQRIVNEFKYGHQNILHHCRVLQGTLAVLIEKKVQYTADEFERKQDAHRLAIKDKVERIHTAILQTMKRLFDFFRRDYNEDAKIRVEWHKFVEKIEKEIEDSLKMMVKKSLQEIERNLSQSKDDERSNDAQLFILQVQAVFGANENKPTIETNPPVNSLSHKVINVGKEVIGIAKVIPRLEGALSKLISDEVADPDDKKMVAVSYGSPNPDTELQDTYHDFMTTEHEALQAMKRIRDAFDGIADKVKDELNRRMQFQSEGGENLWAGSKQFSRMKKWTLEDYEHNIRKYKNLEKTIGATDSLDPCSFIMLDYNPMKATLKKQCQFWVENFLTMLHTESTEELDTLYRTFKTDIERLSKPPRQLDHLSDQMALAQRISTELPLTEKKFEPLEAKFKMLDEGSTISEEDKKRLEDLRPRFEQFKDELEECKKVLEKHKEQFKADLETDLRAFTTACEQLRKDLLENGPYQHDIKVGEAFTKIADYKQKLTLRREKEAQLRVGMEVFKIERPPQNDLRELGAELELLTRVWELRDRWARDTDNWKHQPLKTVNSEEMGEHVDGFRKDVLKLRKELQNRDVWNKLREEIDTFKRSVPVLADLLIPAIRPRHWEQLFTQLDAEHFDADSADFCLERLLDFHIDKHAEFVGNLSTAARQELKIEMDLEKIKDFWDSEELLLERYQTSYWKIASVEEINNALTDHITLLSSMKMSRFVESFKYKVQMWEQTLSIITDTLEALLNVQTKWMYLENIFVGSEDISRKLVEETKIFNNVNGQWGTIMNRLTEERNVMRGTKREGLLEQLNKMAADLEKIQKSLEGFLEDRRRAFPRFYFLSNDDLLEILGHTKEPEKVQPHLRKCFEGLFKLDLKTVRSKKVAQSMLSADGEEVPFQPVVAIEGVPVEVWLRKVEEKMRDMVRKRLNETIDDLSAKVFRGGSMRKRINPDTLQEWVYNHDGQCLITAAQTNWTNFTERCITEFGDMGGGRRKSSPVYKLYKRWKKLLRKYCEMVRKCQNKFQRNKLVALITIEVHHRDILRVLQMRRVQSVSNFDWSQQLRFYREHERDTDKQVCVIRQTSATVFYDYEYLGNSGRLVVTGLTDRTYMTLTTALQLHRGGLPQGPAGTGKTETVKDLGKAIAKYVMVFNCSDGLDYKSLGRMLSGIAQTGAWSCFDEFNRIEVEVLSVVAQQIFCILTAVAERKEKFIFEEVEIPLNQNCGIFVTMNPGYAGRSELPDNLKALLRPISMMVPDFALICEITLLSQGFTESKMLSKRVAILYELMEKQLSKQDHYDFSLRNIKAVLVQAGNLKRENFPGTEEQLCLKAMMDMNLPKFVKDDVPLFMGMLGDLFPGVEPEDAGLEDLKTQVRAELKAKGLEVNEHIVVKVLHLWDTLNTRHGVMVVGQPGSGKTVTWQSLAGALKRMKDNNVPGYDQVRVNIVNPKSVTMDELYGSYNKATREWKDGILSDIMRTICRDESTVLKWLLFDGPVDTLWIESMNTVLDDNKMLTLNSGERINLTPQVSMVFEVQDLSQASPATVSRCGMVFFNVEDLGWRPYVTTWLRGREQYEISINAPKPELTVKEIESFIDTYFPRVLDFRRRECTELFHTVEICTLRAFTSMLDALANPECVSVVPGGQSFSTNLSQENYIANIKLLCVFSMIWSVGGTLTEESRRKFDVMIREVDGTIPSTDTGFEYFVDLKTHGWKTFDEHPQLQHPFRPDSDDAPYHRLLVPTVDTVRYQYLLAQLLRNRVHTVLVGNTGTGKSLLAREVLNVMPGDRYMMTQLNFSAQTTAKNVQDIIEGKMEHKSKKVCSPPGGRRMVCLVEDLNMPAKEKFGAQPPLELLRQWIDTGAWYDRHTQAKRNVNEMQLLMCMTFGRPDISQRLLSKLCVLNVTFPSETVVTKIFTSILSFRFNRFPDFLGYCDLLVKATVQVYNKVTTDLLPIPTKSHYLYNLRDLSKVFQGIYGCHLEALDTKEHLFALWVHECFRVFADRMNDTEDKSWFKSLIQEKLATLFQTKWMTIMKARSKNQGAIPEKENPIFVDFWDGDFDEMAKYKLVPSTRELKAKIVEALESYNNEPGARAMNLVFFTDALEHLCRIHRIIRQPRGNALLVGLGGSGRNSLTRLAAYLAGYNLFSIEIHKKYDIERFHDDLRTLYRSCGGPKKQQRVFYFSDNQIMDISFLEDLNNMLSTGEVPNLFGKDDVQQIKDEVRKDALEARYKDTTDDIFAFFIDRARQNLHLVIAMSPAHKEFRLRLRQFPALVSCTSIDWFIEWPNDALKEVAMVFLQDVDLGDRKELPPGAPPEEAHDSERAEAIADMFVAMHDSTNRASRQLKETLKRYNYVTPSSYLDLVRGYCAMLERKREELCEQRDKLKNGMSKLEETKASVGEMQIELSNQNEQLTQKNKEVDRAVQDIQGKEVTAKEKEAALGLDTTKIEREKANAEAIRADAQADLDKAQPALDEATAALDALKKEEINEMKSYTSPPEVVVLVMEAVQTALGRKASWDESKKSLTDSKFLTTLKEYQKDSMRDQLLRQLEKYIKKPNFDPKIVGKVSSAASGLCLWVRAIHNYGLVYKEVHPKQIKVENCKKRVRDMEEALDRKQRELQTVLDNLKALQDALRENQEEKERLARIAKETEEKILRAGIIVDGLEGERDRWTESIARYEAAISHLVGDALLASGFLSYAGAFPDEYRRELLTTWTITARKLQIPMTRGFDFVDFLVDPTEVRDWQAVGLPGDDFSKENAVVVTRGTRWPLMIDPQGQANKWIKRMEKDNGLKIIDPKQDFMKVVEYAVQFGTPVLLEGILEDIDPALDSIVSKAIVRKGSRAMIKMGDQFIEYNDNFKLYITTRLANPHYTPEICTKVCLLNFAVKQQGLEEQLLKIVVEEEKPDLERENEKLILSTAAAKKETKRLEDEILDLLTTSQVSLLENVRLVDTLQTSKKTAAEIKKQLKDAEEMSKKISLSREQFRPCARRASILYFVLSDLGTIDSMYQFALDSYILLFQNSIRNSRAINVDSVEERVELLDNWHTTQVYKNTCRGLFEKHKLLFSLHMTAQILRARDELNLDEYAFFLKGGQILDTSGKPPNPAPNWLTEKAWDNILELEKLSNFHNIQASFEQNHNDWKQWFLQEKPEEAAMPAEWQTKTSDNYLQRMVIARCLRPDRVIFMVYRFIEETLGQTFVEPPPFNLNDTFDESRNILPLVFVLSPGVDPTNQLNGLAERKGRNLKTLALGQGQGPNAARLIDECSQSGGWVFLANCHLMVSWLQELEKIIENLPNRRPHENFRLWLSSIPTPDFPIAILQRAIKMTTEPPTGIKANMVRLYNYISEEHFNRNSAERPHLYRPLLFALCYFHSVLLERRKFGTLGYNVRYDFNYSDFEVSENIISLYIEKMTDDNPQNVPFPTINFLIADASYGGRVTDDWDRRCIKTYMQQFMNVSTVAQEDFRLASAPEYFVPSEAHTYQGFKEFCMRLPLTDPPEAFGQHANADIASQIEDSLALLDNLMVINATLVRGGGGGGGGGSGGGKAVQSIEDRCMDIISSLEEPSKAAVPQLIDYDAIFEATNEDRASALNTCLLQEIQRYNALLKKIHRQKAELRRAVKGEIIMNDELDAIFNALLLGKVPVAWTSAYPSTKPLSSWAFDLVDRIEQMKEWGRHTPKVFWLAGFTYPTGFLKALQQQQARRDKISIDQYGWEFFVLPSEERTIVHSAREGAFIRGIYLEGAGWDPEASALCEPNPMELMVHMPIIHFRPRLRDRIPKLTGIYECPLYMYPVRTGTRERPSFVVAVDLPGGKSGREHWTKRGTALLLSTND